MNTSRHLSPESGSRPPLSQNTSECTESRSGFSDRETLELQIERRLREMKDNDVCAMFLIHICCPGTVPGSDTKAVEEQASRYTGRILSSLFRATDIVGRLDDGKFIIFLTGSITEESIFEKTSLLSHYLHFPAPDESMGLTHACMGVYLASGKELSFKALFSQAQEALMRAEENGSNSFYLSRMDNVVTASRQSGVPVSPFILQPHILLENIDDGICLLEAAERIRVTYASPGFYRMLKQTPEAFRLPCDLKEIGIHSDYEADYEQVLRTRISSSGAAEHVHRIQDSEGNWIWRHVRVSRIACPGSSVPVLMEISRDITTSMETRRQLQESVERFQAAFGQSHSMLWEVTLSTKSFHIYSADNTDKEDSLPLSQSEVFPDFPESLLSNGLVHPNSAEPFLRFSSELLGGKSADTGNFIMKDRAGNYSWFSLSYRQTYDDDWNPVKAIGIQERLPAVSGIFSTGFPRRPIPEALRHYLLARIHVNLSRNSVEELWRNGFDQTSEVNGISFTEVLARRDSFLFHQTDERELERSLCRERLLELYEKGEYWFTEDYQRIDSGGDIRWLTGTFNLLRDDKAGEIHLYACFCDSQQRHIWESFSETGAKRDPVSGLYTPQTARSIAEHLIRSDCGSRCALALIHMSGSFLHSASEQAQDSLRGKRFISIALSFALGTDCVIGQQENDIILVFFPNISSRFNIKKRIEDAFAYVHTVMGGTADADRIRFISCVVTEQTEHADFELLVSRASSLCGLYENAAMDTVALPDQNEDWTWTSLLRQDGAATETVAEIPGVQHDLTPEELKIAFNCVVSMLNSRSLKASMENVLRILGLYYHASRLYILSLSEKRRTITMIYEWVGRQKYSIQQIMSGMPLEKFPLLLRCLKERTPVTTKSEGEALSAHGEGTLWYFTVFPLFAHDEVAGFFCMENAQEHSEELSLIEELLPYMRQEPQRYRNAGGEQAPLITDTLSRLPNLHSYLDTVDSLNSDVYSSMGVLSLDIPNFSAINGNQGFGYGREMLCHVAETLSDVFGKTFIFRIWDAEFVVLYPNTIMEVFVSRCTRVRTMLQRRYPDQLRIGYTWADGIFTSRNLVKEARSIMCCENVSEDPGERLTFLGENRFDAREVASADNLIAYFQPKIDMRDGSLAGAEALARGIDRDGRIIPPAQFIETMEKDGSIRQLDLSMLEKVLEQLSKWKKSGLPPVTVSVNISRFTLFNPTTLASILAIESHFPEIPPEQVKLEITETAGDIEKATLSSLIDSFRKYGLFFDLDDFGSHYANMSIFSNIRFNAIKLDRSLINDLPGNEISRMLVENIVRICRNFDMHCVAEGVETRQQEAALLEAGCVYGQGYYYARPLPPGKFEEQFLRKQA